MSDIIGYDNEGNPIYGAEFDDMGTAISPKKKRNRKII
jgi:hypothetical protein